MSYFNEDQQAYMKDLAAMPKEKKCGCGWYHRGECPNCKPEDGGRTINPTTKERDEK